MKMNWTEFWEGFVAGRLTKSEVKPRFRKQREAMRNKVEFAEKEITSHSKFIEKKMSLFKTALASERYDWLLSEIGEVKKQLQPLKKLVEEVQGWEEFLVEEDSVIKSHYRLVFDYPKRIEFSLDCCAKGVVNLQLKLESLKVQKLALEAKGVLFDDKDELTLRVAHDSNETVH